MYANPKETTSLKLDATMKRRSRELLALHGMTPTEAFEESCVCDICAFGEPRGKGQHHEDPVRGLHGERLRGR